MMLLFLISATITLFLLAAGVILLLGGDEPVDARLMEIAASPSSGTAMWNPFDPDVFTQLVRSS